MVGSEVIVVTAVDITQKKRNQQKIEYQAHNDFLTGLYNRMKCEVDLRKVIRRTERQDLKERYCLLILMISSILMTDLAISMGIYFFSRLRQDLREFQVCVGIVTEWVEMNL